MIPAAILCLALLAFIVYQQRRHDAERKLLLDRFELERNGLLNRIQAPELAVLPEAELVPYVAPDDDEAYWEAVKEREG